MGAPPILPHAVCSRVEMRGAVAGIFIIAYDIAVPQRCGKAPAAQSTLRMVRRAVASNGACLSRDAWLHGGDTRRWKRPPCASYGWGRLSAPCPAPLGAVHTGERRVAAVRRVAEFARAPSRRFQIDPRSCRIYSRVSRNGSYAAEGAALTMRTIEYAFRVAGAPRYCTVLY
eukprot:IDg2522t1